MVEAIRHALQEMADIAFLALRIWQTAEGCSREVQLKMGQALWREKPNIRSSLLPDTNDPQWIQCLEIASIVVGGLTEYERN